ncbi:GntR family transcriptional regulator [Streptomyces durbertensis]|uniref:GntR family transcriptional regulator n=1 Tax=Streptomyces durbertensis TaxID=2448886 RepID=A0ABR6EEL9_9ACTN|nr:GntR family transcriptional regulator [Streptomyces durbertensis]MBB1243772.1 GntR family transcriptional regulator [Streptomyces durbertensis]
MPGTITRNTLRQQIADALRDEVLAGRLLAGRNFTVKEIAEQYGVSATPVREALVDLSAQGLLDSDQHRGYRVHEFTPSDYGRMVEAQALLVRGVFRTPAVGGAHDVGRVDMKSVRRRAEASRRAALAGELDVLIGYDLRFWRELCEILGNPYVTDFLERIRVHCWVYCVPPLRALGALDGLLWAGHLDLFEAVERGDCAGALRVIDGHHEHALDLARRLAP